MKAFDRTVRKVTGGIAVLFMATNLFAAAPEDFETAKREYERAVPHGNELARSRYVTSLAAILEASVADYQKTGVRRNTELLEAIDAELRRHPAPRDSDSQRLSQLLPGKWRSPRHDYLFRKDGSWVMLPLEKDATHGTWRFEGNLYFDRAAAEPGKEWRYRLVLLNAKYFVFCDQGAVFFEVRIGAKK